MSFGQAAAIELEQKKKNLSSGTISEQFDYVFKNSNRYQEYRVIKMTWFEQLKSHVADSLKDLRADLSETQKVIEEQKKEIEKLNNTLQSTEENLTAVNIEKGNIKLLGISMKKAAYNTIMFGIIAGLAALLAIFIMRYLISNRATVSIKKRLDETIAEFEGYKQRAVEKEQKLRRELQDEINKRLGHFE